MSAWMKTGSRKPIEAKDLVFASVIDRRMVTASYHRQMISAGLVAAVIAPVLRHAKDLVRVPLAGLRGQGNLGLAAVIIYFPLLFN